MPITPHQLVSYIAPAAPATRRPAEGDLPFLRPEIGFTPRWYRDRLGIDFGERWHTDPSYRRDTIVAMRAALRRRFHGTSIGGIDCPDSPLDLLTGLYGTCFVAGLYGVPIIYSRDGWPESVRECLGDDQADSLQPPDLDANPLFRDLIRQVEWIAAREGQVEGFINWQGVLNNAHRLRGEKLFYDLVDNPNRCRRLFDCVCTTMTEAAKRLHARQRDSGVTVNFFTVSNCLVNMVSPEQYREFLLPLDRCIAESFGCIGIHNCDWKADPYMDLYAMVPHLAYVDMGPDSDLRRARKTFARARRAIMVKPTDLVNKTLDEIREDIERIAHEYAPCDLVVADLDTGTPDRRVQALLDCLDAMAGAGP